MQILNEMGTLKDGRTVLLIKDAYNPNFVIVRGYNRETGTWDSGTYCDGNLVALAKEILDAELPIGYDRMKSIAESALNTAIESDEEGFSDYIFNQCGLDDSDKSFLDGVANTSCGITEAYDIEPYVVRNKDGSFKETGKFMILYQGDELIFETFNEAKEFLSEQCR